MTRLLTSLVVPGGLIVAAAVALQFEPVVALAAAPYATTAAYGTLATALLLGWYFDHARVVAAAMAVGLVTIAAGLWPDTTGAGRLWAFTSLAPGLVLFAWFRDRGVVTIGGAMCGAALAGATYLTPVLIDRAPLGRPDAWLPHVAFGLGTAALGVLVVKRRSRIDQSLLWTAVVMWAASGREAHLVATSAVAAGLVLVMTVLEQGLDIAYADDLTGLPNRRSARALLGRLGSTYALALCDVDHFKQFNDRYGHEMGNEALRMVAQQLSQVGGGGRAFRYGGEEFLLVFKRCTPEEAQRLVHALREAIGTTPLAIRRRAGSAAGPAPIAYVSISCGVASRSAHLTTPEQVIEAADAALYRAKADGRDCVRVADGLREAV